MNRKGFAPIVILLILAAVLAIGGGALYLKNRSQVETTSLQSPIPSQQSIKNRTVSYDNYLKQSERPCNNPRASIPSISSQTPSQKEVRYWARTNPDNLNDITTRCITIYEYAHIFTKPLYFPVYIPNGYLVGASRANTEIGTQSLNPTADNKSLTYYLSKEGAPNITVTIDTLHAEIKNDYASKCQNTNFPSTKVLSVKGNKACDVASWSRSETLYWYSAEGTVVSISWKGDGVYDEAIKMLESLQVVSPEK